MAQDVDILRIDSSAQEHLADYIKNCALVRDEGWQLRGRLEDIDRAYMREKDFTEEQRKAQKANKAGDPTKLQNMQVPMIMESVENSVSFLTNVFLLDYPMYKFVTDPEYEDIALMWNTLVGEDQIHYGWAAQFNIAFRNGAKYNFAPIECDWDTQILHKPMNGSGKRGVTIEQLLWEGNCIYAPDPYNTIYDPRVPIHRCHIEGEFGGYIRHMTRIQLKMYLASLGESRLKNDVKAFEAPSWDVSYYTPYINPSAILRDKNWYDGAFNWVNWVTDNARDHIEYQNMYTVVKLYARIMPSEFGIRAPRDQTPDVWKLICVNGVMVYAAPIPNAHNYLPLVIVQPLVDNLDHQTKSQAENQMPFQDMVSALWNATLQSARRVVTDRMLYNPLLVDPDHINSPNPSAKIPLRPTAYGRKLEEAIYQIPFHNENVQFWMQGANGVAEWGMRANGQNKVSVGQFQKGNKLQSEFDTTMANANSRERTQAIMWEATGMQPIKEMIKNNILQFAPNGKKYNRTEGKMITVDPSKMREIAAEFEVGDGLLPIQRLVSTEQMQAGMQTIASVPGIATGYDLPPLFSYLMKVSGVDKLGKFEKSVEQRQYELALGAWQNAATNYAKSEKTPEEIAKILGPMPQPPQPTKPGVKNAPTTS